MQSVTALARTKLYGLMTEARCCKSLAFDRKSINDCLLSVP